MAGIKPFVQQAVRALEKPQLQLLSEALRVDLRGCDERADVERVLTGLLCLDQDSSLGVFLSWWLSLNQQSLSARKPFQTTFVPAISSPRRGTNGGSNQRVVEAVASPSAPVEERVPEHHLDDEIRERLGELDVLEQDFKVAERGVHTGSPSFDKLKTFLVALAQLRHKEAETRRFLLRQAKLLRAQHDDMQRETLHTRGQLDFFVAGFTNLRRRHDELLDKAARLAAENESAHALFVEMSAEDAHFSLLVTNTLQKQLVDMQELRDQVKDRDERLDRMKVKQDELLQTASGLKQQRGDARKDAHCFKQQLRVCKARMREMEQGAMDAKFLRKQASELRQSVATLLSVHLRDAIQRDTKSAKQTLSKEAMRIVQRITAVSDSNAVEGNVAEESGENIAVDDQERAPMPSRKRPLMTGAKTTSGSNAAKSTLTARKNLRDVDEVVKGVLLVGGSNGEAETCAKMLAEKLKYLPVDVTVALEAIHKDLAQSITSVVAAAIGDASLPAAAAALSPTDAIDSSTVTIARYATQLSAFIRSQLSLKQKRAFVLFNWSFSGSDVDWLKAAGLPIDSVLELQVAPPAPRSPAPLSRQVQPPSTAVSSASSTARAPGALPAAPPPSRGKLAGAASTTNGAAKTSPSKSPSKARTSPSAKPSGIPAKGPTVSSAPTTAASKEPSQKKGLSPAKSPAKSSDKAPGKAQAKSPAKAPAKSQAKAADKSPAKSPAKAPAKSPVKAPAKSPANPPAKSLAKSPSGSTASPKKSQEGTSPTRPPTTSKETSTSSKSSSPSYQTAASTVTGDQSTHPVPQQQQPKRPTDHRSTFRTQLQVFQSIAPAEFAEDRFAAVVSALEREKTRRLVPVIKWDEEAQRTQEQLAMFGEEILTLLAIEQETRKPAAKKMLGSSSTTAYTSSSVATSRGVSRGSSRATSPAKEKKSTTTARGGRSPTASDKKSAASVDKSPGRRATEVVIKSPPKPPTRRLTQQTGAPSPPKVGKAAR